MKIGIKAEKAPALQTSVASSWEEQAGKKWKL